MNERDIVMICGTVDLAPNRRRFDPYTGNPHDLYTGNAGGYYPRPYVDILFLSDEEKAEDARRQEQARSRAIRRAAMRAIAPAPTVKYCARCHRNIKPQYTHCYRCFNYLQVKARIAKGA